MSSTQLLAYQVIVLTVSTLFSNNVNRVYSRSGWTIHCRIQIARISL